MADLAEKIIAHLSKPNYQPQKPKALARQLGIRTEGYAAFRKALRDLVHNGRVEMGKNHMVRNAKPHGTVVGVYRRTSTGNGYVRPNPASGQAGAEILIRASDAGDAATGDQVLVRIRRLPSRPDRAPVGEIVDIVERSTRQFVGTYFERDGEGLVRVDGTVFSHSVYVGDPGAKGVKPNDKVVIEMVRFPSAEDRGEGVVTEVLGPRGKPGVDTLSIIRGFAIPDVFPEDALEEARDVAARFRETDLGDREDLTADVIVTIDPPDAHDFDDAISLTVDSRSKHWHLGVHIADVAHFVTHGGALDREARKRGTSVYLPQRVIPMLPELISNSLASLQQGRVRYVKSVFIDFTPAGQKAEVRFANAAIKVRRRFTYDEVSEFLEGRGPEVEPEVADLLTRMRDLAMILRKRRMKRGALELYMPETELEYDDQGRVTGAHFHKQDVSHQVIEEFMLAANEAVAEHLDSLDVPFLRRTHSAPDPKKLEVFAEFARILGYKLEKNVDRFSLQRVLKKSFEQPDCHAVHYALLRSLKQATYTPQDDEHYALASDNYCHFTSPIRRYPDLTVHRQIDQWLRAGRAGADFGELAKIGDHCSKMERRAEIAERELIKLKLLAYLSERVGVEFESIITGVADYGFFSQSEKFPIEGLVHVSTLTNDYYYFDEASHSLIGQRHGRRFRLGDRGRVQVVRVDLNRRQLDFRVVEKRK